MAGGANSIPTSWEKPRAQTSEPKSEVKHCLFCDKLSKDICSDKRMADRCSNITNKKEYFVWRETKVAKPGVPIGSWDYATNVATTREIAVAICKLMQTEHPAESLTVSSARPKSYYL